MKKQVKVVTAIIEIEMGEILCALRSLSMSMPNMWEFPGGKVEENEDIFSALKREISEEINCEITTEANTYMDIVHDYETVTINLISIKAKIAQGTPKAGEHSKLMWLGKENLLSLVWAPADIPTVEKIIQEK